MPDLLDRNRSADFEQVSQPQGATFGLFGDFVDSDAPMSLTALVQMVRSRFELPPGLTDHTILAALQGAVGAPTRQERWLALFNSPLGAELAKGHRDLSTSLGIVISHLPPIRA